MTINGWMAVLCAGLMLVIFTACGHNSHNEPVAAAMSCERFGAFASQGAYVIGTSPDGMTTYLRNGRGEQIGMSTYDLQRLQQGCNGAFPGYGSGFAGAPITGWVQPAPLPAPVPPPQQYYPVQTLPAPVPPPQPGANFPGYPPQYSQQQPPPYPVHKAPPPPHNWSDCRDRDGDSNCDATDKNPK